MAQPFGLALSDSDRQKLIAARTRAGLTQAALAERLGCDRVTVARIEAGIRNPSLDLAGRMAGAVGLELRISLVRPRV